MRVKKEPKRKWENICHCTSDIAKVKNLNEIYRYVYYKPQKYHWGKNCAEWVYIDIALDDLIEDSEIDKVRRQVKENYDFVARLRCTGIKDKFENLIFEGDITEVKFSSSTGETGCVMFDTMSGHYSKGCTDIGSYKKGTEIVGDIFQTPELAYHLDECLEQLGIDKSLILKEEEK